MSELVVKITYPTKGKNKQTKNLTESDNLAP